MLVLATWKIVLPNMLSVLHLSCRVPKDSGVYAHPPAVNREEKGPGSQSGTLNKHTVRAILMLY
jgi:hypothetical protein